MKVLLVEPKYGLPGVPWSPWGKIQLAAYLRPHGFDVSVMDNALFQGTDEQIRQTIGQEVQPDIIGIGGMTLQLNDTLRIARIVRQMYDDQGLTRPLLVAGGVHFTFCPEDGHELFDLVVLGEGEQTLLEICQRYQETSELGGEAYEDILGIEYRTDDGQWGHTVARPFLDLSTLPIPAFDCIPWYEHYADGFITGQRVPMLMTGRGCPFDCEFCASPQLFHRKTRSYSIEWLKDCVFEMRKFHPGTSVGLRIMDDTFALSDRRVQDFCSMVQTEPKLKGMRYTCLTHCNTVKFETMQLMKESGFFIVALGIESGNDEVLKKINKMVTVEQAAESIGLARKSGLFVEGLFMMANIGETEQSCLDTIEFAKRHNPPDYSIGATWNWFQFATPFPGSRFYDEAEQYGTVVTRDYERYHHQEPVFIPHGMTSELLISLRERAFREAR